MLTAVVSDVLLRRLASAGRGRGGRGRQLAVRDYAYDGRGRRISKAVTASGDLDRTEYYYYDGQQMIEQRDGSEQTAMQVVFGTEYIDEPVRLDVNTDPATDNDCLDAGGSAFYYYHQDANFNVVALTDSSGDVAQRYLYDAYGTPHVFDTDDTGGASREILDPRLEVTGSVTVYQPFLFTGRFYDFETNLYHYRARTYHPALGPSWRPLRLCGSIHLRSSACVGGSKLRSVLVCCVLHCNTTQSSRLIAQSSFRS